MLKLFVLQLILVDAAATVGEAAPALLVVVANLVQLYARSTRLSFFVVVVFGVVGELALVATLAVAITKSVARGTRAATIATTTHATVSEATVVAAFAVSVTEVEALSRALLAAAGDRGRGIVIITHVFTVGEAAVVTTFAGSITVVEAHAGSLLAADARAALLDFAMGELAIFTTVALAIVTEGEALALAASRGLNGGAFVLTRAVLAVVAAAT